MATGLRNEIFIPESNFEMVLLGEGFDATVEDNQRLIDNQVASKHKMIELSCFNLPQGSVGRI